MKTEDMHRLEFISVQNLWTLEGIDAALDCASQKKETEISAILMDIRAGLVDKSGKKEPMSVDKTENPGSIKRRKRFEL